MPSLLLLKKLNLYFNSMDGENRTLTDAMSTGFCKPDKIAHIKIYLRFIIYNFL